MDMGADNRRHAMCTLWQVDNDKGFIVMVDNNLIRHYIDRGQDTRWIIRNGGRGWCRGTE